MIAAERAPAWARRALAFALLAGITTASAWGATFVIVNQDPAGEGLNDPTPVDPVFGNAGTTRGAQRLNVFQAAANRWGAILSSSVTIRVETSMQPLNCDENGAILGSAGPTSAFRDFPNAPRPQTWFVPALANALSGSDRNPAQNDISAEFNSSLDNADPNCISGNVWSYAIGLNPSDGEVDFFSTVLHELGHGLGFLSMVDDKTGEKSNGFDDAFMVYLEDHSLGKTWPAMTDAERQASAINTGNLHWVGAHALAAGSVLSQGRAPGGHIRMYAPHDLDEGSSVSHWDTTLTPNELMEPEDSPNQTNIVTTPALQDIGWKLKAAPGGPCFPSATTLCIDNQAGDKRFEVKVQFQTSQGGGSSGNGKAIPLAPLGVAHGGMFWFFSADNPEMLVKVINGCAINGKFWFFSSAGTNVGLTTTLRDTQTGNSKPYNNPDLTAAAPIQDTAALACGAASETGGAEEALAVEALAEEAKFDDLASAWLGESAADPASLEMRATCIADTHTLCIAGRFRIQVTFHTSQGGGQSGSGNAIALNSLGITRGGLFWFFSADNPELLIKVLDGCGLNQKFWVFYSAGTNVGFNVTVTDLLLGHNKSYGNLDLTPAAPKQDTAALSCN